MTRAFSELQLNLVSHFDFSQDLDIRFQSSAPNSSLCDGGSVKNEEVFYGPVKTTMTAASSSWRDNLRPRRTFRMGVMGVQAATAPLVLQMVLLLLTCKW